MLKINRKFKNLIPPLSAEEFGQLEKNILAQGCRDAITTWRGVIVDGHNRHEICTKHGIAYKTEEISLASGKEATLWIVENQLGRRNLSDEMRIKLAMQKTGLTRKQIADYAKVTEYAVQKYMRINNKTIATKTVRKIITAKELKYEHIHMKIAKLEKTYHFIMEYLPKNESDDFYDTIIRFLRKQRAF